MSRQTEDETFYHRTHCRYQIPETTRVTVVGEEVFIPLTQKNLTTGAGVIIRGSPHRIKYNRMPKNKKEKINGKISRGRLTS